MSVNTIKLFRHGKAENWTQLNAEVAGRIKDTVKELINQAPLKFNEVKLFLMDNTTSDYNETTQNLLSVFIQSEPNDKSKYVALELDGAPLGYYHPDTLELYLSGKYNNLDEEQLFEAIKRHFSAYMEEAVKPFAERNSWLNRRANPALRQRIKNYLSQTNEQIAREARERAHSAQSRVDEYTRKLKENYDKYRTAMADLAKAESAEVEGLDAFIKGLDAVAEHPKVAKLEVEDTNVVIGINDVHTFARVKGAERRFYLGNMEIKINIANTDVKFFNMNNPRNGFWTGRDPHPHVNGSDGRACLGNVGTTIAELCSQMEIYALFLVCLDFLENANTDDPAGKKVVNWDECDEQGNPIAQAGTYDEDEDEEEGQYCPRCDGYHDEDEFHEVLIRFNSETGAHEAHEDWCEGCVEDDATYHEASGEHVHDEILNVVEAYYNAHV